MYDWLAVNNNNINYHQILRNLNIHVCVCFHHHNKKITNNVILQINSTEIERVTHFIF